MAYTMILFSAKDSWHNPIYSFKINMLTRELSVEYSNNTGGITTNGVALNERQYQHIKRLAAPRIFEKFRDGSWKEHMDWFPDPNEWEAQFISDDGTAMLTMERHFESYPAPPALAALVEYVMHIGALGNMNHLLF